MRILSKTVSAMASVVALAALSGAASAASLTYNGAVFSSAVTGSGTNYTLTMTMDFTGADGGNEFLGDMMEAWSLTIPGAAALTLTGLTINNAPAPIASWSVQNTAQADAKGCGNGNVNTICVDWLTLGDINGGGPVITTSDIFVFTVDLVFGAATDFLGNGNFHLLSVRETPCPKKSTALKCYKKDGGLISQRLVVGDDDDQDVPEPGTLALLGLGLVGLGLGRRRRA